MCGCDTFTPVNQRIDQEQRVERKIPQAERDTIIIIEYRECHECN